MRLDLDRLAALILFVLAWYGIIYITDKKQPADIQSRQAQARYLLSEYGYTPAQIKKIID